MNFRKKKSVRNVKQTGISGRMLMASAIIVAQQKANLCGMTQKPRKSWKCPGLDFDSAHGWVKPFGLTHPLIFFAKLT